jgi:FkbM family methyltransferase
MKSKINKFFQLLRLRLFPSDQEKEVQKWYENDKDENLRYLYDLCDTSVVIDLGGYKGQWASDIYSRYNCSIMIFEPVKQFAQKIEERFIFNHKIEVFPYALGAQKRKETIYLNNDGTSVYAKSEQKEAIEFEAIDTLFEEKAIGRVDLLKMNIEGGEYEVLPVLIKSGLIRQIKNLQIQFHQIDSESESRMKRLQDLLSKTHRPTYQYKFVWENWKLK